MDMSMYPECKNKYYIGTSFHKIGTAEFPMYTDSLDEALEVAEQIRAHGFTSRIYLRQTITIETLLVED